MPRCLLSLTLLLSFGSGALCAQSPDGPLAPRPGTPVQQAPAGAQVRLRVSLVNTPVTVRDNKGNLVNNLDVGDFRVTDSGIEQKIVHFDFGGDPLSLVILLETSSRIDALLPELRKSGILFTQTVLGSEGEAAIVGFNDAVDKLQDFTRDDDAIEKTLAQLQTGTSGSRLYDAMAVAVDMLSARPQRTAEQSGRRRVVFVLSETQDVGSETKLGEVLRKAQLANVTIFSVGLSTIRSELRANKPRNSQPQPSTPPGINPLPPFPGSIQTPETEAARAGNIDIMGAAVWAVQHIHDQVNDHAMDVAAAATGGDHLSTYKDRSIEKAIDEIGAVLHAQYAISYTPSTASTFGYHQITVTVDREKLRVRSRPGYYVPAPGE